MCAVGMRFIASVCRDATMRVCVEGAAKEEESLRFALWGDYVGM